jgi:hypothetical protein
MTNESPSQRQAQYGWVATLPPEVLRELANMAHRATGFVFDDPAAVAAELVDMLAAGTRPTIGWYRRHRAR